MYLRKQQKAFWFSLAMASLLVVSGCNSDSSNNVVDQSRENGEGINIDDVSVGETVFVDVDDTQNQSVNVLDWFEALPQILVENDTYADIELSDEGVLSIEPQLVDRPREVSVLLVDPALLESTVRVRIALSNVAGQDLVTETQAWITHEDQLVQTTELRRLFELYEQIAWINQAHEEAQGVQARGISSLESFNQWSQDSAESARDALTSLGQSLSQYRQAEIGQSDLNSTLKKVIADLDDRFQQGFSHAEQYRSAHIGDAIAALSLSGLIYSPEKESVSSMLGNQNLGAFSDTGDWVFDGGVDYLQRIVNTYSLQFCEG